MPRLWYRNRSQQPKSVSWIPVVVSSSSVNSGRDLLVYKTSWESAEGISFERIERVRDAEKYCTPVAKGKGTASRASRTESDPRMKLVGMVSEMPPGKTKGPEINDLVAVRIAQLEPLTLFEGDVCASTCWNLCLGHDECSQLLARLKTILQTLHVPSTWSMSLMAAGISMSTLREADAALRVMICWQWTSHWIGRLSPHLTLAASTRPGRVVNISPL